MFFLMKRLLLFKKQFFQYSHLTFLRNPYKRRSFLHICFYSRLISFLKSNSNTFKMLQRMVFDFLEKSNYLRRKSWKVAYCFYKYCVQASYGFRYFSGEISVFFIKLNKHNWNTRITTLFKLRVSIRRYEYWRFS